MLARRTIAAGLGGWRRGRRLRSPRCVVVRGGAGPTAIAILAACAVGAAAYWSGTGAGAAMAVVPDPQAMSFGPGIPTGQLYPGGTASVEIVAHNPNSYSVLLASLELDAGAGTPFAVDAGHSGCDVSALSFVTQDNGGEGWSVPPKLGSTNGTLAIDLPAALHMSVAAANACQGATFTVRLAAPA